MCATDAYSHSTSRKCLSPHFHDDHKGYYLPFNVLHFTYMRLPSGAQRVLVLATIASLYCVGGASLLQPLWTKSLPNTTVPPANAQLGWSLLATSTTGASYYATTTVDHTLWVLDAASGDVVWQFSDWNDGIASDIAYQRSIVSTDVPWSALAMLLVLRGNALHCFDLASGHRLYMANVAMPNGAATGSMDVISGAMLLLQAPDSAILVVVNASSGSTVWSTTTASGSDSRTGANFLATIETYDNNSIATQAVVVRDAASGRVATRVGYPSAAVLFMYIMTVDAVSVTFIVQQDGVNGGGEQVCRYALQEPASAMYCLDLHTNIWGYGVAGEFLYLQVDDNGSLAIRSYFYANASFIASTGQIPNATAGSAHIVGEPSFALLAFTKGSTYYLTGWHGADGSNAFTFTFTDSSALSSSGKGRQNAAANAMQTAASIRRDPTIYELVANWNGQLIVPTANTAGFHYVDGVAAALDDTYVDAYHGFQIHSTALTSNALIFTNGANVTAFQLIL